MAIDALSVWKSTMAALPKTTDNTWAANFSGWINDRLASADTDPTQLVNATPLSFVLDDAGMQSDLEALSPSSNATTAIADFADAFEASLNNTVVVVTAGAFIPPSGPTTLFSAVSSTTIDAASITAAKAKINELASEPPVADVDDSKFPEKYREAFLLLTITVIGTDSDGPPNPLTAAAVKII